MIRLYIKDNGVLTDAVNNNGVWRYVCSIMLSRGNLALATVDDLTLNLLEYDVKVGFIDADGQRHYYLWRDSPTASNSSG